MGLVSLILWAQTCPLSKMMQSCDFHI
jgi:hypothetical protein